MGKNISLLINVVGQQVKQNSTANQYAVTFDANGGVIDGYGNSEKMTQIVTYHQEYGELPTPTRNGYEFVGWNGKNILNKEDSLNSSIQNESNISGYPIHAFSNAWIRKNLKPNKTYTISYEFECISITDGERGSPIIGFYLYDIATSENTRNNIPFWSYYEDNLSVGEKIKFSKTFETPSTLLDLSTNYVILAYTRNYIGGGLDTMRFYNLQIEEGEIEPEFEPYFIQEDTRVVQNSNHTLKAIWKKE